MIERLEEDSAATSDQKLDGAQGLRSVCNSVLLKEFQTKVNRKQDRVCVTPGRTVTERLRQLSVSLLRLIIEHSREERQKTISKLGHVACSIKGKLWSVRRIEA